MIVIGVDVHMAFLAAVAVDEVGREVGELTAVDGAGLLVWSGTLPGERLWAVEDCRQLTRALERDLVAAGERLVRVPPKLTAPQRRTGRERGKSDPVDALAVARAALREPRLDYPRPQEPMLRELKMLVDHRDCLVAERTRAQQRLRWHLHELDPAFEVPAGGLDRTVWLDRLGRRFARGEQTVQTMIARELVGRCRDADPHDPGDRARPPDANDSDRPRSAGAARLRPRHGRENTRRDRPDRPLPFRRPARPPRRRRTTRGEQRQAPTPPPRPRRQPATQPGTAPDRDHPGPHAPSRTGLHGAQTGRRQEPPRSPPLPKTTPRPHHPHHPQKRAALDIGATLAQASDGPRRGPRTRGLVEGRAFRVP